MKPLNKITNSRKIYFLTLIAPIITITGCNASTQTQQKKAADFPIATSTPLPTAVPKTFNPNYNPNIDPSPTPFNNGYKYPIPPQSNNFNYPTPKPIPNNSYSPPLKPSPSAAPPAPQQLGANEAETTDLQLTNSYRAEVDVRPLQLDSQMSEVARQWSVVQHDRGDIGHDGFQGRASKLNLGNAGENVAMNGGFGNQTDSSMGLRLSEQWRDSPGHYSNMIGTQFHRIGIGIYCGQNGCYGTQIFGD